MRSPRPRHVRLDLTPVRRDYAGVRWRLWPFSLKTILGWQAPPDDTKPGGASCFPLAHHVMWRHSGRKRVADMQGKAIRRHHSDRMKAKARRIYPRDPRAAHRADYLAICSCWMCRNPRHSEKGDDALTLQERRQGSAGPDDGVG
jgi:hypothetical protein